ncbi:MAG: pantetheine-phosphate adenylyltransferase [Sphingobacteriaceae bacterium]|nr:MAG: pantetheine-phosphate adenylyltransferase [Sphingobacteriaceae bacterium]
MNIKPIKTELDYENALSRLEVIFDADKDTPEGDELEILSILIEKFEDEHYPIDLPDPIEAIKFRMEQMGYNQVDLAKVVGLKSRASEILNKKRKLSEKREQMLKAVFADEPRIEVIAYEGLTVEFCKKIGAGYMIRGIRTVSDFEYEKAIAQMNHALEPEIESIFIVSKPGYSSISSTIVREILKYNGDVSQFIPKEALAFL